MRGLRLLWQVQVMTLVLLGTLAAPGILRAQDQAADALVLVVSQDTPIDEIREEDLRRLFLAEVTSLNGHDIIPLNQPPGSAERQFFDRQVLEFSPDEMGRYWIDRKVRGQKGAPRNLPGALLPRVLAKFPNAIGYIRADQVSPGLKIVKVSGKGPGDKGYPLARGGK